MPRTIRADGRTITVPDDATPEEINQIVGPPPTTSLSESGTSDWRDPLTRIEPHQAIHSLKDAGTEVNRGIRNIGGGALGVALHPVNTVGGILKTAVRQLPPVALYEDLTKGTDVNREIVESFAKAPLETAESMIGQTAALGAGEALAGKVAEVAPKGPGKVARFLTKTTPKETGELVKDTKVENQEATDKAATQNQKNQDQHVEDVAQSEAKRKVDLRKHFDKTQAAKESNAASERPASQREALTRGVERLETDARGDLDKLEDKVNVEGNRKYSDLRKVLKDEVADPYQPVDEGGHINGEPVTLTEHLYDVATEPLRGSETESAIIKSLGKRTAQGDVDLTYNDLQGYREEIGKELRSGKLQPDTFTAYKGLMEAIDDAMGKIAERKGLKPQQDAARAYWRQYRDTFIDSDSPFRKWKNAAESPNYKPGMGASLIRNADTGIQQIARFDPELAQRLNHLRGYQSEAKALPSKPGKITSLPKLAPKQPTPSAPEPVSPELKTINSEDIRGAKLKSLQKRVGKIRSRGEWIATGAAGYGLLSNILHGDLGQIPADLFYGGAAVGGVEGIARILENPKVVEFLTKPTPADVAQVPPELRGDLDQIAQIAAKKGIRVDPRLYAVAGATPRKRVAAAIHP